MSTEVEQILNPSNQSPAMGMANTDVQPSPTSQPKEEQISSKLAVLMERERHALTREQIAKSQEEKLSQQLKMVEEFESLKKDPTKVNDLLGKLGWDYDKLTQSRLTDGEVPPTILINQLRDELHQVKEQLKQKEDLQIEADKKRVNENEVKAIGSFKSEINEYLKSNSARYELIDFESAHELVFDVIDEQYNRTIDPNTGIGKVMTIQEAADKVESHLEKKYLAAKDKNKVKAFWSNMPKGIADQFKKQEAVRKPNTSTLTNNLGPQISEKSSRMPEDKRIQAIVSEHMAKMRSQYV